jgi:hypothetical protein
MRRVARRRNRCRNKAPSCRRAPRPPRKRTRSATNWRDPTACSARPQELTRKFAHQRLRRAIRGSFLHPAAPAAIRRSGRNKSGVAAASQRTSRCNFHRRNCGQMKKSHRYTSTTSRIHSGHIFHEGAFRLVFRTCGRCLVSKRTHLGGMNVWSFQIG